MFHLERDPSQETYASMKLKIKVNIKGEKVGTGLNKFGAVIGSGVRFGINAGTNPGVKNWSK